MSEIQKEKKSKIFKTKPKYEVSKPSYLIPFNPEKFFKIYRKSHTPTKRTNSADNSNKQNLSNKLKIQKIINSNRQNKIEHEKISKIQNTTKKKDDLFDILHRKNKDYKTISQSSTNIKNVIHNRIKNEIMKNMNSPKKNNNLLNSPILNKTANRININNNNNNNNENENNSTIKESKIMSPEVEDNFIHISKNDALNQKMYHPVKIKYQNQKRAQSRPNSKTLLRQLQDTQNNNNKKINIIKSSSEKNLDLNKSHNSNNSKNNIDLNISFNKNSRKSTPIKSKNNSIFSFSNKKPKNNNIEVNKIKKSTKNNTYREINTSPFIKNKRPKENNNSHSLLLNVKNNTKNVKNTNPLSQSNDISKSNQKNKINHDIKSQIGISSINSLSKTSQNKQLTNPKQSINQNNNTSNINNNNSNSNTNQNTNNESIKKINNNPSKISKDPSLQNNSSSTPQNPNSNINPNPTPSTTPSSQIPQQPLLPQLKTTKTITHLNSICKKGFSGPGLKKTNQDNYFIYPNFLNTTSTFLGVCDGHGLYGHLVSSYLISTLPQYLNTTLIKDSLTPSSPLSSLTQTITKSFIKIDNDLTTTSQIDTTFSGSTCVTTIITPSRIICANTGDSRAVLGKFQNGLWISQNLSRDHKPSEEDEMKRILSNGGRIQPYKDENNNPIGPERVWVLDDDVPGLAMSRSFGDEVAHDVGVISIPEVWDFDFGDEDKFVVVASDGLWEFISSEECVKIVGEFYLKGDINGALNFLYRESSKRWIMEEEVIDDITIVIVFFD